MERGTSFLLIDCFLEDNNSPILRVQKKRPSLFYKATNLLLNPSLAMSYLQNSQTWPSQIQTVALIRPAEIWACLDEDRCKSLSRQLHMI